ncbi:Transposon Tn7 transposition protein tnsB [Vibrio cholerae]|nr:Transposon Tn7 transposition protein tnsB [Vibrio cholerae]
MGKGFMYFCFMVFFETFWYGKREYESLEYLWPERMRLRANKIEYQKDIRSLQGTATSGVRVPSVHYESDATIADIYLLSANRQKFIG